MSAARPKLSPQQVCFVVDDVSAAVQRCEKEFAWGPFYQFTAPVENAVYKDWTGKKLVEVALGMAGNVQVEFIHVFEGHDAVEAYQAEYKRGFQHLGIQCHSREAAVDYLTALGAKVDELNEFPGIRFAFVDVPTGSAMFELLQQTKDWGKEDALDVDTKASDPIEGLFQIDRATIVTDDIETALVFYAQAFGWDDATYTTSTLHYDGKQNLFKRFIGHAGTLDIELLQPLEMAGDPYSLHLNRGSHGLVHAGGLSKGITDSIEAAVEYQWLESKEKFSLSNWLAGSSSLQMRY